MFVGYLMKITHFGTLYRGDNRYPVYPAIHVQHLLVAWNPLDDNPLVRSEICEQVLEELFAILETTEHCVSSLSGAQYETTIWVLNNFLRPSVEHRPSAWFE